MSGNVSFVRKVIYFGAIAILLLPLSWLSQPAIKADGDSEVSAGGGKLAQLRTEYNLSQADLGEIDPAGETMKLATLGLRGVAANVLWHKAYHYKKVHDWDNLRATLNQITKIQPNFVSVWEFQAHNLSYNVSVEFDDYRHRYHWVKKGIEFLIGGTRYNRNEPRLLWTVGWFLAHKIGASDEKRQFRRLFKEDEEFQALMDRYVNIELAKDPYGKYDNWLVARLWYLDAYDLVENSPGASMRGKAPLIYYADAPFARINLAESIMEENDPGEGEIPKYAWSEAARELNEYGNRQIRTSFGAYLSLNGIGPQIEQIQKMRDQLNVLVPGVTEELMQQIFQDLAPKYQAVINKSPDDRTEEEEKMYREVIDYARVSPIKVAEKAGPEVKQRAVVLARKLFEEETMLKMIDRYRSTVNYPYWEQRCASEATDQSVRARKNLYDANRLYSQGKLETKLVPKLDDNGKPVYGKDNTPEYVNEDGAKEKFEKAWDDWAEIFDRHPILVNDAIGADLASSIQNYISVLQNLGEEDRLLHFKLMNVLDESAFRFDLPSPKEIQERFGSDADSTEDDTPTGQDETPLSTGDPEPEKSETTAGDDARQVDTSDKSDGENGATKNDAAGDDAPSDDVPSDDAPSDDAPSDDVPSDDVPKNQTREEQSRDGNSAGKVQ